MARHSSIHGGGWEVYAMFLTLPEKKVRTVGDGISAPRESAVVDALRQPIPSISNEQTGDVIHRKPAEPRQPEPTAAHPVGSSATGTTQQHRIRWDCTKTTSKSDKMLAISCSVCRPARAVRRRFRCSFLRERSSTTVSGAFPFIPYLIG
ncbi:alpha-L-fucosidase [Anopheles sinensis]|uniref:Alpha-L-fucosidase n=1 Tax=Anopheles sinensis TaxID=74873 RepID=A0A084WDL7_ANOSI|nr:alpha-L-fucosidase [Anopheles sinensis]